MAFTWLDKFTDVLRLVAADDDRRALEVALVEYGALGVEPGLDYPLCLVFEAMREDVDYSVKAHRAGSKGGRPKGQALSEGGSKPSSETPLENPLEGGLETPLENPSEKPLAKGGSKPKASKAKQSKAGNAEHSGGAASRAFAPPTVEEVRAYAEERGYTFDPEAFVAHYAARGWRYGRGQPMKDWKAACVTWQKREEPAREEEEHGWWDAYDVR